MVREFGRGAALFDAQGQSWAIQHIEISCNEQVVF